METTIFKPVADGYITHGFDEPRNFNGKVIIHGGLDIGSKTKNAPIINTHDGVVVKAGWSNTFGWRVWVHVAKDFYIVYGHMKKIDPNIKEGMPIDAGTQIGWMGSTGMSKADHLHYGWRTTTDTTGKNIRPIAIEKITPLKSQI